MRRLADDTWSVDVPGVGHGDRYRYRLDGGDRCPTRRRATNPTVSTGRRRSSIPADFAGPIRTGPGSRLEGAVYYELHVATFTAEGTFDAAADELIRLRDLGVTVVELMPVNAFPGARNWGYDGVFPSAVQESYGGPERLAALVDTAHALGMGVAIDVVYNHLGPEGNVLGTFAPFFTDAYATPWGDAVNFSEADSDQVRRFFIESACGWIRRLPRRRPACRRRPRHRRPHRVAVRPRTGAAPSTTPRPQWARPPPSSPRAPPTIRSCCATPPMAAMGSTPSGTTTSTMRCVLR